MQLTNHPETRGKSESPIGVTGAKNLKNLGMYGLLIGTFEARHKTQAIGSKLTLAYFQQLIYFCICQSPVSWFSFWRTSDC